MKTHSEINNREVLTIFMKIEVRVTTCLKTNQIIGYLTIIK